MQHPDQSPSEGKPKTPRGVGRIAVRPGGTGRDDSYRPARSEPGPAPKAKKKQAPSGADAPGAERLQKVLASAGVGSRRTSEELIAERRVTVDGKVAKLGDRVDPATAEIYVDGQRIIVDSRLVYLAMNKPRGVVSTMADEQGREALADFVTDLSVRVYHVGRLDADSEGLLLLTNDGGLAHKLMHPSFGVPKTYLAEVDGPLPRAVGRALQAGVELEDGPARVDSFRLVDAQGKSALIEITLHEGRKHIVRRMLEAVGHPVNRLVRTAIGPIKLGDIKPGRTRRLNNAEIAALFKAVEKNED